MMHVSNTVSGKWLRLGTAAFLTLCILPFSAAGARVLFYPADPGNPDVAKRLELACRFYGISLENGSAAEPDSAETPTAVVIEAGALGALSPADLPAEYSALLIAGIDSHVAATAFTGWINGTVRPGTDMVENRMQQLTVTDRRPDLTGELAGRQLPADIHKGYSVAATPGVPLVSYPGGEPLFVEAAGSDRPVYLLADLSVIDPPDSSIWFYDRGFFAEIAPMMMFLRKSFGEYAWHADGDYANLTIDDPWLCESYGNLNFSELLREMDRAGFHTTIAYIPWNYDRPSSPDVVNLFRDRPDRFSLCIHGNNHDHREFYSYEDKPGAEWPARPLADQEADIRQGLARIKKFESLSGLSVDRVMVFPHGIAPDRTLGLLKKYNFTATSNAGYIPLDTLFPNDPLVWLRRVTDHFGGGLASLDRAEPAHLTETDIAVDLFLDNPVLFVEHLRFFSDSRAAFNAFAGKVNGLQPSVEWVGLGTLAKHLYLMRKEDDGSWAVRSFSPDIILSNPDGKTRTVRVLKTDDGTVPVRQVLVNGQEAGFTRTPAGQIQIITTIPPQQQRRIRIVFENDFVAEEENLGKPDLRINLLRHLSDIRDQHLATGPLGALIDRFYYDSNLYQFGMKALVLIAGCVLAVLCAVIWILCKMRRSRRG